MVGRFRKPGNENANGILRLQKQIEPNEGMNSGPKAADGDSFVAVTSGLEGKKIAQR